MAELWILGILGLLLIGFGLGRAIRGDREGGDQ